MKNMLDWIQFSSLLSHVQFFATPLIAACQASLSITNSWSSLKPTSIKSVMPSSYLFLCCPLLLLPPIPPSIRIFSNESTLRMRWPKYWSIIPSREHPGLISFRMDWLDLLAVQGTCKSFPQHHSSKAWILWRSAFFIVQLSHPYMTTGKTIALTAAATAKSLQSCPTLCDSIDGSPPGSPAPRILQARTLEWIALPSPMHESEKWKWSRSVVPDSLRPHGRQPTRLLHPWDFPGKSTGVGCHRLLHLSPRAMQIKKK